MLATILTDHPLYPVDQRKYLICDDGYRVGALGAPTLEAWLAVLGRELLQCYACAFDTYQARDGRHLRLFLEPTLPMLLGEWGNTG